MKLFEHELIVDPAQVEVEDGGAAKIFHVEDGNDPTVDAGLFVRLQSYDESAWQGYSDAHARFDSMLGKRVRVTVEVLD